MKSILRLITFVAITVSLIPVNAAETKTPLVCGVGQNKDYSQKILITYSFTKSKKGGNGYGMAYMCTRKGSIDTEDGIAEAIKIIERDGLTGVTPLMIKVMAN